MAKMSHLLLEQSSIRSRSNNMTACTNHRTWTKEHSAVYQTITIPTITTKLHSQPCYY